MNPPGAASIENRVLVLAPTGADAPALCRVLHHAGWNAAPCSSVDELCRRVRQGAAAAIVADEALTEDALPRLESALAEQPEWSDFPLIVMTSRRAENARVWLILEGLKGSAHLLLLERPVSTTTLTRAVDTVFQSRTRQYQIRDQIEERGRLEQDLRRKVEELAEADRRKDEFLAVLGHELRNPLAAIVNGIQALPMLGEMDQRAIQVCDLLGRLSR